MLPDAPTLLVLAAKSAAADSQLRETLRLALFRLVAPGGLNPREDSRKNLWDRPGASCKAREGEVYWST